MQANQGGGGQGSLTNEVVLKGMIPGAAQLEGLKSIAQSLGFYDRINQAVVDYGTYLGQNTRYQELLTQKLVEFGKEQTGNIYSTKEFQELFKQVNIEFSNAYGRISLLTGEQVANIDNFSKVLGQTSEKILNSFSEIGYSVEDVVKFTGDLAISANKFAVPLGLVADKVVPKLSLINKLGFTNGVVGLTEMVAQSQLLKLDFDKIQQYGEKMFDPEQAQMAANKFTMLGAQISEFKDPFFWMGSVYDGFEKITPKVSELFSTYLQFDEATGRFKVPKGAITDIQKLADEFGITYEEAVKTGGQFLQVENRVSKLRGTFKNLNEDELSNLAANVVTTTDAWGKLVYQFDLFDKEGKKTTISKTLDQLQGDIQTQQEILKFYKPPEYENATPEDLARKIQEGSIGKGEEFARQGKVTSQQIGLEMIQAGVTPELVNKSLEIYKSNVQGFISTFNSSNAQFKSFLDGFNGNISTFVSSLTSGDFKKAFGDIASLVGQFTNVAGTGILESLQKSFTSIVNTQLPNLSTSIDTLNNAVNRIKGVFENIENWSKGLNAENVSQPGTKNQTNLDMKELTGGLSAAMQTPKVNEVDFSNIEAMNLTTENTTNKNVNGKVILEVTSSGNLDKGTMESFKKEIMQPSFLQPLKVALENMI
jgi:hypothetical protein